MTGRFHKGWGDFGGLRSRESLLFDCLNSIANGGTCSIGDHMHPRGRLDDEVYSLVGDVYRTTKRLERWTDGARSLADIAVVDSDLFYMARKPADRSRVAGASRMLMELKHQFDVCDDRGDLTGYRVLVLPDEVAMTPDLLAKLEAHVSTGGAIVSSGRAGLDATRSGFALDTYGAVGAGVPDLPITVYSQGIAMTALPGAELLAEVVDPYLDDGSWDWHHENAYLPPDRATGRAAVVQHGSIIHFAFPLFGGYAKDAVVHHRTLFGNCLARLLADPIVRVTGMPSFGQVTVAQRPRQRIVHLMTYVPELRGRDAQVIEEPMTVGDIELASASTVRR